jgi:hypothetical protein
VFLLGLLSALATDMGTTFHTFIYSVGGYVALLLLIILRRPANPTNVDLVLVAWALRSFFSPASLFLRRSLRSQAWRHTLHSGSDRESLNFAQ